MDDLTTFIRRVERLLDRIERSFPEFSVAPQWEHHQAFRWRRHSGGGYLQPVNHPHRLRLQDLRRIERQKTELERNTQQFLARKPCNNALLWGARGTGKSSLIKALFNKYADQGLRLIEVDKQDLMDLSAIVEPLYDRPEKFLLYCDDLSFSAEDPSYKALKAILDGSISVAPQNVLLYVTSNRRHLLPEFISENREARMIDGELHHGEAVEEKISLSERFGLWLSFHPFGQDDYLAIVEYWLKELGYRRQLDEEIRNSALRWALHRGSRSGRVAWQFARDRVGQWSLDSDPNREHPE